jgi:hypothetical protein
LQAIGGIDDDDANTGTLSPGWMSVVGPVDAAHAAGQQFDERGGLEREIIGQRQDIKLHIPAGML